MLKKMKKSLDKIAKLGYNNHKEVERDELLDLSFNPNASYRNHKSLFKLAETINKARASLVDCPPIIIAGGYIRDTILGLNAKDFDLFFDVSAYPPDETEDMVLLALAAIRDTENNMDRFAPPRKFTKNGEPYELKEDNEEEQIIIYEMHANMLAGPIPVQLMGHRDALATTDPLKFVEKFDYGLVRALFNPETMKYSIHSSFFEELKTKNINFNGSRTKERVFSFLYKLKRETGESFTMNGETRNSIRYASTTVPWFPQYEAQAIRNNVAFQNILQLDGNRAVRIIDDA